MAVIRWAGFAGENRALQPMLLPDEVCTVARNQKPGRGDARPWRQPLTVASVPAGRKTIYRMGRDVASDSQYWLSWPTVVHAMRGSDKGTTERTYYTGDGPPKVTDNIIGLASAPYPTTSRPMGIPAPATPIIASTNEGAWTGLNTERFYVYTYVSDWGWESAPSAPSAINTRPADATASLSGMSPPPAGNYGIDRVRVYATQAGSSGAADFFFLREVAVGAVGSGTSDDNRTLNEVMTTTGWLPAPLDLKHLTPLWNGMAAGISEGAVRFSEPYVTYAWPFAYEAIVPDGDAVALGTYGQTLVVLTNSTPMLMAGTSSDSMDQAPTEFSQACIAPRSAVSMGAGVAWASNDGLCWMGAGGPKIITAGIMLRDDWLALRPETIVGQMYEGAYLGSYDDGSGRKSFLIDPISPRGIYFFDLGYEAMHFDSLQDQLYVLSGPNVQRWDAGPLMTMRIKSKVFRAPRPTCFAVVEVVAESYPITLRLDAVALPAADVAKMLAARPGVFTAPTPTTLRYSATVTSRDPARLPSGLMALDWQMEIETTSAVQGVSLASSMQELAQV